MTGLGITRQTNSMRFIAIWSFLGMCLFLAGCDKSSVFEGKKDFKNKFWVFNDPAVFEFEISNLQYKYDLTLNVRTTGDFKYQNLYIQYYLEDSTNQLISEDLKNIQLFHPVTGIPVGEGIGGSYDVTRTFLEDYSFTKRGKYILRFDQFMRIDTLQEVLSIGLRVQKSD